MTQTKTSPLEGNEITPPETGRPFLERLIDAPTPYQPHQEGDAAILARKINAALRGISSKQGTASTEKYKTELRYAGYDF